jgi:hypothetical protein
VVFAAPLSSKPLRRKLKRLAEQPLSIAEINRRVGERAWELGLVRPSYHRVRQLVHEERDRLREPSWGQLLFEVDARLRTPDALLDKLAGTFPMDEDAGMPGRPPPRF